jgi:voltage-gated potassium channel
MKRAVLFHPLVAIARRLGPPLAVATALLLLCGTLYWRIEPNTPTFTDALWLAFATASTIGYGDIVPSTPASRLLSVGVLLLGFSVLSLVTAAIATLWVESHERQIEREILRDVHAQIGVLRRELADLRRQGAATAPADATAVRAGRRRSASPPARNRVRSADRA